MATVLTRAPSAASVRGYEPPVVEIAVPVYNEVGTLARSIVRLSAYLQHAFPFSVRVTIADNGSTDGTWKAALALAARFPEIRAVRLEEKGRGRALKAALLHLVLRTRFSDAQCGFKAIRADRARELLPLVRDGAWFFDTELLVLAERAGLRIHEVPVDWVDDPDTRVEIVATALADLRGVLRLARNRRSGFAGQVARFGAIGVASTIGYTLLYLALRPVLAAQAANAIALLVTAIGNTAANRRLTFAIRGAAHSVRHQIQGLVVFGLALALTSLSLVFLHAAAAHPSRSLELAVLVAANLVATVLRFVLLRSWVFRARRVAPVGSR